MRASSLALLWVVGLALSVHAQDKPDALVLYRAGNYRAAADVCLAEIQAMPYNADSYTVLGWSLLRLGEYEGALAQSRLGLSRLPEEPRLTRNAGEAAFHLGRIEEALRYMEDYAGLSPQGDGIEWVYAIMGECFIQLKEYSNADIAFSTALHLSENDDTWWARLGYVREMARDLAWSLEAYDNSLRLNPNNTDAQRGKGRVEDLLRTP